jgi:hypothetical protein
VHTLSARALPLKALGRAKPEVVWKTKKKAIARMTDLKELYRVSVDGQGLRQWGDKLTLTTS